MSYESMTGAQLIEAGADTCANGETVEAMRYALRMLANNLQHIAVEASIR